MGRASSREGRFWWIVGVSSLSPKPTAWLWRRSTFPSFGTTRPKPYDDEEVYRSSMIFVAGNATYKSTCRSVRRSVGPSVPLYFFSVFELFEGRIARVLVSCGCLCPCPNHFCPCPTHYCPCPTARDRGSRVYGLVTLN